MRILEISINGGLGDNLATRIFLDSVKSHYDNIAIQHNKKIINDYRNGDIEYYNFLNELGNLLFCERPYFFVDSSSKIEYRHINTNDFYRMLLPMQGVLKKPNLDHLCQGETLNLNQEYIVITTKVRVLSKKILFPLLPQLWQTLNQLSHKYKIVILGEKVMEVSEEYKNYLDTIYCIYDEIIKNVSSNNLIDLTIPALGITIPNIKQIQKDLLIMKNAKYVINLGVGGSFLMAISVANTIGFRCDNEYPLTQLADLFNNPQYPSIFISKDWQQFISKLGE